MEGEKRKMRSADAKGLRGVWTSLRGDWSCRSTAAPGLRHLGAAVCNRRLRGWRSRVVYRRREGLRQWRGASRLKPLLLRGGARRMVTGDGVLGDW